MPKTPNASRTKPPANAAKASEPLLDFAEIRRRRTELTLSMDEAGRAAGQSPARARQWWNDIESGRYHDLRISTVLSLCRALRCDVEDLLVADARPSAARPSAARTAARR